MSVAGLAEFPAVGPIRFEYLQSSIGRFDVGANLWLWKGIERETSDLLLWVIATPIEEWTVLLGVPDS